MPLSVSSREGLRLKPFALPFGLPRGSVIGVHLKHHKALATTMLLTHTRMKRCLDVANMNCAASRGARLERGFWLQLEGLASGLPSMPEGLEGGGHFRKTHLLEKKGKEAG